ncbi:MAG: NitT/TauT family transport system substrate-binding protein [Chloroflexota bacterium]|jgi:NitT/TauT family transport system substrate-binding protein|nr:NitT/TauT family transport system substrate-binding protein [Chloroflexota bacterium]
MAVRFNGDRRPELSRREFLRAIVIAGGGLAVVACTPKTGAPPAASTSAAGGPAISASFPAPKVNTSTKVAGPHLESILSPAPLAVGNARGFWDEYGLKQEFTAYDGGGDVVRGITSGANAYAVAAPTAVISAFVKGEKLRLIGCSFGGLTIKFVVLNGAPYQTISELAGKKIGFSTPGSNSHFLAQESLRVAGVQAEVVAVGGATESITALRTGIVDATWAADPTPALNKDTVRVLWDTNTYAPKFMETVLATTADYAAKNGDVIQAFLAGYDKGDQYIKQSPEEAGRVWAQAVDLGDKADLIASAFKDTKPAYWTLRLDPEALQAIEKSMRDLGQIDQAVNWKELVDQSFLPESLRASI